MPFAFSYEPGVEAPFRIFVSREDKAHGGTSWRPQARLCVMPSLRSCGLIQSLEPQEFASLVLLVSFVAPDGRCGASVVELAGALGVSAWKARARFDRLARAKWNGQGMVFYAPGQSGLDGYFPVPGFVPATEEPDEELRQNVLQVLPRETVIERSRRIYGRPRRLVEREIEAMMGWDDAGQNKKADPELTPDEQELREKLLAVGLLPEQAREMTERFDSARIRRQLAWLDRRGAKNKASYLIAAVKDDYAPPRGLGAPERKESDEGE